MFKTRLISGIVLVILAAILFYLGGDYLLIATGIIALMGLYEFYRLSNLHNRLMGYAGYLSSVSYCLMLRFGMENYFSMWLIITLAIMMCIYVFKFEEYRDRDMIRGLFGIIYVVVMLLYIYKVRVMPEGNIFVWLILISSWGCDTSAYVVGMLIGRHKLAPVLSPKKSIEGAVGGMVGAVLLGVIYALILGRNDLLIVFVITGIFGGALSQIGDLTASGIKRNHNAKDYGNVIPGHGGVLDRFDSVIFASPIVYVILILLVK